VNVHINKAHYPVTTLGPGTRVAIWFQGCTLACHGCLSRDTWDSDQGSTVPLSSLFEWIGDLDGPIEGITVSGGEPFQQPAALRSLLEGLDRWRRGREPPVDLLAYSGYTLATLRRRHARVLERLDGVIPEPFRRDEPSSHPWLGSANQRIVPLTPLGRSRYTAAATPPRRMQVHVDGTRIWYVGVPRVGDIELIDAALRRRGIEQRHVSWRP
jgi:anaerobic ribonucleoside-triphosphate reductase activating protein